MTTQIWEWPRDMTERYPEEDRGYTAKEEAELDVARAEWTSIRADMYRACASNLVADLDVILCEEGHVKRMMQQIEYAFTLKTPLDTAQAALQAVVAFREAQAGLALSHAMDDCERLEDWEVQS